MPTIDSHPSVENAALHREAIASLRANRIDPKFLYVTPHQAELWRQVFLRHSPIHANPEFTRIYRNSFAKVATQIGAKKIMLVGLGCGTGLKELDLYSHLKSNALFAAIDVSRNLVAESAGKLIAAGAEHQRSLVCDLAQTEFLGEWLNQLGADLPRVITFFGLFPNFAPSVITRLFRSILRPGDLLLASAHLAPVQNENRHELPAAMNTILPQYNNPETLAWLTAALEAWDLQKLVEPPQITVNEIEGIPALIGTARWKTSKPFEKWGHRFSPRREEPLRLFYSLRYTPALFENLLRQQGFAAERLAITSCREEAVWSIRHN